MKTWPDLVFKSQDVHHLPLIKGNRTGSLSLGNFIYNGECDISYSISLINAPF